MQCIQVREIKFDEKGLRVGTPGRLGARSTARSRATRTSLACATCCVSIATRASSVPADASAFVYVLDLVIESEQLAK